MISVIAVLTSGFTAFLSGAVFLNLSNSLHNAMLKRVTYASMSFFNSNPLGRIINRFSKDTALADSVVTAQMLYWLQVSDYSFRLSIKQPSSWAWVWSSILGWLLFLLLLLGGSPWSFTSLWKVRLMLSASMLYLALPSTLSSLPLSKLSHSSSLQERGVYESAVLTPGRCKWKSILHLRRCQ